ncbi:uncharacterized protein LOC113794840 [Dermatophagoides pteronyssinus]|uniref:uncharacterized protein LOC113794840 n=1 Tax=Dermatophagoides pteronyssinus TaxID=6956 RepID=UPI003F66956A
MNPSDDDGGWFHSFSSKLSGKLSAFGHRCKKLRKKQKILKKSSKQIIEMKQILPTDPLMMKCDYKILLIGSKGSGKTSLVNRFLGRPFNPREKPTIGFNLMTLDLNYEHDHLINVELWDTAGDNVNGNGNDNCHILSNEHFYYRNVNLMIAVFDLTDSKRSFDYCLKWIDNFRKQHNHRSSSTTTTNDDQNDVQIIIVGNKLDLMNNSNRTNYFDLEQIEKYSKTIDCNDNRLYRTSAKTMEGNEQELFEEISRKIINQFGRQQQMEQLKNLSNLHQDSTMIYEQSQQQTWLLVSVDLSVSTAKLYDDADFDPFNGQLMKKTDQNGNDPKSINSKRKMKETAKTTTKSITFALFLRKLFCLI